MHRQRLRSAMSRKCPSSLARFKQDDNNQASLTLKCLSGLLYWEIESLQQTYPSLAPWIKHCIQLMSRKTAGLPMSFSRHTASRTLLLWSGAPCFNRAARWHIWVASRCLAGRCGPGTNDFHLGTVELLLLVRSKHPPALVLSSVPFVYRHFVILAQRL